MRLVEINALENGAHRNQTINSLSKIPNGWAVIPNDMDTPNFPFGNLTAEKIDGVMTVISWTPGVIPEVEISVEEESDPKPTVSEILNTMLGVSE